MKTIVAIRSVIYLRDQLVERYVLITYSTTFAGESGPRARSQIVVEGIAHMEQSQMCKVKGDTEI